MEKYQLFDRTLFGDMTWLNVLNLSRPKINCEIFEINLTLIFSIKVTKDTGLNKKNKKIISFIYDVSFLATPDGAFMKKLLSFI